MLRTTEADLYSNPNSLVMTGNSIHQPDYSCPRKGKGNGHSRQTSHQYSNLGRATHWANNQFITTFVSLNMVHLHTVNQQNSVPGTPPSYPNTHTAHINFQHCQDIPKPVHLLPAEPILKHEDMIRVYCEGKETPPNCLTTLRIAYTWTCDKTTCIIQHVMKCDQEHFRNVVGRLWYQKSHASISSQYTETFDYVHSIVTTHEAANQLWLHVHYVWWCLIELWGFYILAFQQNNNSNKSNKSWSIYVNILQQTINFPTKIQ